MPSRALPISCAIGLVGLAAVRVMSVWNDLPERVASHFGPSGQPDGWQGKAAFFVLFGVIGFGTTLLLLATPSLLRFIPPSLINIPYREYWLAPSRIDEALHRLARYMDWFSVAMTMFLVATLELVLRANMHGGGLDEAVFIPMLIGFLAFTVAWSIVLYRGFRPPH